MFVKVVAGAFLASVLGVGCALAQSAADIGGPRELPPAGYSGQQYVDSRGCVFLRAGLGGAVNWVPRVDRNRKAMCGYPPTFGGGTRPAAVAAAEPVAKPVAPAAVVAAPKPAPVPAAKPAPVRVAGEPAPESYVPAPVRGVTVPAMAPVAAPAPQRPVMPVEMPGTGNRIACTTSAPVPKRLALTNGGTVVVCTRGDGTLEGLRAPAYPAGSRVGASLDAPMVPLGQPSGIGDGLPGARLVDQGVNPPPGYKLAWEDDRLNPLRGVGTAEGQAAQDRVWTRKHPAKLVNEARPARVIVLPSQEAPRVSVSSKSAPQAGDRVWVQVGSFGVASNADGAAARLSAMGLPVARSNGSIGGKAVQVVLAGPFGSAGAAQAALGAARGAGFGDAFIR